MGFFKKFKKIKEEKVEVEKKTSVKESKPVKKENTGNAYRVLVRPLITEKGTLLGKYNQYSFMVDKKANKIEIKKAIQNVYGVSPLSVNVINMKGKSVRYGRTKGKTKDWKKALVTLRKGDKITIHEGV